MQHKITERKPLLDEKGILTEAGYATDLVLEYDRNAIKANREIADLLIIYLLIIILFNKF